MVALKASAHSKNTTSYKTGKTKKVTKENAITDLISGGGAVFLTMMAAYLLIFFYKLLLARNLGAEEYGLFEMFITILGFIAVIAGLGFTNSVVRFIPLYLSKSKAFLSGYMKSVLTYHLFSSILASVILFLLADNLTSFFNFPETFTTLLYILALMIPLHTFSKLFQKIIISHKKVLLGKLGQEVIYNGVILLGVLVLLLSNLSLINVVFVLVLANLAMFLYYLVLIIPLSKKTKSKTKKYEICRWVKFSIPLLFVGILSKFLGWTDNLVIGRMLTSTDLGVYGISFSVAYYLFIGSMIFSSIFLPIMTRFYEKNKKDFKELFMTIRNWTMLTSLVIGAVFVLFAEQILLFLFGAEFVAGANSLRVLSAFFIIANYFYFSAHILQLEDKTHKILVGDIITLILNLAITIFLVSRIGILGAAIGSGFSFFFVRFLFYLMSRKYIKIGHDYSYLFKCFILAFGAAFISYFVTNIILAGVSLHLIAYIAVAGIFYLASLILGLKYLKILKQQDLIVFEFVERYTKINLSALKRFLVK